MRKAEISVDDVIRALTLSAQPMK